MAIYHFHVSSVSRSKGQNAVAAAAYISASKLVYRTIDKETGEEISITYDYRKKKGVIRSNIKAPEITEGVEWVHDREKLWNKAEEKETRKNSVTAGKLESALPKELTAEQNIELVEQYIDKHLIPAGMIVDYNIHYDNLNNPHVHFQTTTRDLEKTASGELKFSNKKNREWWRKEFLKEQRVYWANEVNHHLKLHGILDEITHKSFKDLGIDLIPTTHRGVASHIKASELQEQYDRIIEENANSIRKNSELVFQKLSINKPVFTKEDIAIALSDALMIDIGIKQEAKLEDIEVVREFSKSLIAKQGVEDIIENKEDQNKIKSISDVRNIEGLNEQYVKEFMKLYEVLLHSDKIELINPQDLQGRTLYALKERVNLERRFVEAVEILNIKENHNLRITEANISKLNIREEIGVAVNETGFKLQKKFNEEIGSKVGINLNLFSKRAGEFSEEQKRAIVGICNGKDISLLEGYPGAGKTFVMREIVRQYKEAGYQVIGTGPSSVSAQVLGKATGIEARNTSLLRKTIQESQGKSFKLNLNSDYYLEEEYLKSIGCDKVLTSKTSILNSKTLLIVDEASMLDLASMDYLVNEALKNNSKLLVVGDNNQFAAVGITGAFNKIKRICTVDSLKTVRRHVNQDLTVQDSYRKATELLGRYQINDAISIYNTLGVFNISDKEEEAKNNLITDYIGKYIKQSARLNRDDLASIRSVVIGVYTNESVSYFNQGVRERLKHTGILKGECVKVKSGTDIVELMCGDQIVFEANSKSLGVLNGEVGTVLSLGKKDNDRVIKILVHKADSSKEIIEINTQAEQQRAVKFRHGYAVTGYKLQGETIDHMYVYYESNIGYEAFNVLMSRHRYNVEMYGSKEELESLVYKRIDSDVESVRQSYAIEAYELLEREITDDFGKTKIIREKEEVPSWLVGLVIGVSRRVNNNFALDYRIKEVLDDNLLVIKDYLESRTEVFRWHKKMQEWKEQQEQPALLTDLCNRIKDSNIKIGNPRSIIIDGYALIFADRQIDFELRRQEKEERRVSGYNIDTEAKIPDRTPKEKVAEKRAYIFSKIKDMAGKSFKDLDREDQNIVLLYYLSPVSKKELLAIYGELEKAKNVMSAHAKAICNSYNGWVDKKLEEEYGNSQKILEKKEAQVVEQRRAVTVLEEVIQKETEGKKSKLSKKQIVKLEEEYAGLQKILKEKEHAKLIQEKAVEVIKIAIQRAAQGEESELSKKQITMGERIIQLNLNYETILKHAELARYKYYLKNIEEGKTINSSLDWQKLMRTAKDVSNGKELKGINFLTKYIARIEKFIADNGQEISVKQKELAGNKLEMSNIKQETMQINEYQDKLLPNYLGRIYKTSAKDILNKWEELKEQNKERGISELINKVKRHPNVLGKLKGIGIGTLLPISKDRAAAVKHTDILTDQLIKYDTNKQRIGEIETIGGCTKYEKTIEILEQGIKLLQNKQPNKYEEKFLAQLKLMQAIGGLNKESFKKYVVTDDVQDLIYEHYNTKNEAYKRLDSIGIENNIENVAIINSLAGSISKNDQAIIEIQEYLNANNPNSVEITKQNIEDLKRFGTEKDMKNVFNQYKVYGIEAMNDFLYKTCQSSIEQKITSDLQIMQDKWSGALGKEAELITIKDFNGGGHTNDYDYLAAIGQDQAVMRYISKDSDLVKKIQNEVQRVRQHQTTNELD